MDLFLFTSVEEKVAMTSVWRKCFMAHRESFFSFLQLFQSSLKLPHKLPFGDNVVNFLLCLNASKILFRDILVTKVTRKTLLIIVDINEFVY